MKKLMFALTAVACATVVNAANVNWGIEYASNPNGDLGAADTAYLFVESASLGASSSIADNYYSRSAMLSALAEGTFTVGKAVDFNAFDYGESPTKELGGFNAGIDKTETDPAQVNNVKLYSVIVSQIDGADYAYITDYAEVNINHLGGGGMFNFGDLDAADRSTGDIGNWYALGAAPTPEPTSGLLLLLGVAGLALRRRRA